MIQDLSELRKKITVLVQGKLHPNTLVSLRMYAKYFNVVFSTWRTKDLAETNLLKMLSDEDFVIVIAYNQDHVEEKLITDDSRYLQYLTTYRGLLNVETDYVIKTRTDEYYTDLMPLVEKFLENDEMLVSNNVFFRKTQEYPFHPSDHLYIGKTKTLQMTLCSCIQEFVSGSADTYFGNGINAAGRGPNCPEQQLGINWIRTNDSNFVVGKPETFKDVMKKYFDVVSVDKLGYYCVAFNGKYFFDDTFFNSKTDIKEIEDL